MSDKRLNEMVKEYGDLCFDAGEYSQACALFTKQLANEMNRAEKAGQAVIDRLNSLIEKTYRQGYHDGRRELEVELGWDCFVKNNGLKEGDK